MGLNSSGQTPFAVGIDRHSSTGFFYTNNPDRFPTPESHLRVFPEVSSAANDVANTVICRFLDQFGMDSVFSSRADAVNEYLKNDWCRLVFFHAAIAEMGDSTKTLVRRFEDLLVVLLYNGALPDEGGGYYRLVHGSGSLYEAEDGTMALVKPSRDIVEDIRILFERVMSKV